MYFGILASCFIFELRSKIKRDLAFWKYIFVEDENRFRYLGFQFWSDGPKSEKEKWRPGNKSGTEFRIYSGRPLFKWAVGLLGFGGAPPESNRTSVFKF